ncbi:MAG: hypothetical protein DI536_34425 [Archangium gephyra]|uniref:Uncharacterized protein n=1 Tax=Archangium gephyra TaxID=48 RepID=A0A2W5SP21_9BACT|nr:MAG: hypothetical protein DI536_34425 [Archangium gephyra]
MTIVFLGGSRHVKTVHEMVLARLERMVLQQLRIVVGDAPGADSALQATLAARRYQHVEVFFTGKSPRNNVGAWPTRVVRTTERPGTAAFHSAKDRALAQMSTVGLMVWDGKSAGTVANAGRLVSLGKVCVVFLQPEERFVEVRTPADLEDLVAQSPAETQLEFRRRMRAELPAETAALL